MATYKPGQIIRFIYNHKFMDEETGDRNKEVMVLHPNWQGKMHAIDLKRLTMAEREVLDAVFDPQWQKKRHRLPLVNDVNRRMNVLEEVKNPHSFYYKFVKVFLRNKDAYRQYWPNHMMNVTVVQQSQVQGHVTNPKPLFHKVETKAPPKPVMSSTLTPAQRQARLDKVKNSAQKLTANQKNARLQMIKKAAEKIKKDKKK